MFKKSKTASASVEVIQQYQDNKNEPFKSVMSLIYSFLLNNSHPKSRHLLVILHVMVCNLKQKIKNTREKRIFVDEEEVRWRNKVIPYMIDLPTFSREYLYMSLEYVSREYLYVSVSLCIPVCVGLTVFHCLFVYIYPSDVSPQPHFYNI